MRSMEHVCSLSSQGMVMYVAEGITLFDFIMRDEVKVEWWYLTILVLESIPDETRHLVYETNCC